MTAWLDLTPAQRLDLIRPLAARGLTSGQIVSALVPQYGPINRGSLVSFCLRGGVALIARRPKDAAAIKGVAELWSDMPPARKREAILALIPEGLSAGQIAGRLSVKHGPVTRGAVIGFVRRNGILLPLSPGKAAVSRKAEKTRRDDGRPAVPVCVVAASGPDPVPEAAPDRPGASSRPVLLPEDARPVPLFELTGRSCRYPVSHDPRGVAALFCGAPTSRGSYCACHVKRVYTTAAELKADLRLSGQSTMRPMRPGGIDYRRTA
ncbi:GcrA family cell cycle regulator [Pannonibacter tanglangensis]|uniref:GcrA cell cycle regulator n=1 Tax=Pannonibacter tanglangensis TaxID=2750084 RepID=A0ABW9ZIE1_9HYPH|nr:GcrA family cell cycle regulator [Pannonibacter sp. XCT-34]NBN62807.1 hypothetical protein [Pannonibacter sp. XCT-34]